jgi:hypothetical protein
MNPGSSFLWNLARWNQGRDDLRGVDALAIIGNGGYAAPLSGSPPASGSDGIVSLISASLGFSRDPSRTRILPYCHTDSGLFVDLVMDCNGSGIATAPETGQIVRSFLAGTTAWMAVGTPDPNQNPWLSQYGGMYFALENAPGTQYLGLTNASWGNVALQPGGSSSFFYREFVTGTETLQATSAAIGGTVSCGSYTVIAGFYSTVRCKYPPAISGVGPILANTSALTVQSGGTVIINGAGFGPYCSSCAVWAYPGPQTLQVLSWSDQTITVSLPASFTGFVQLLVQTATGSDAMGIEVTPRLDFIGSMAHLAAQENWTTTFTLVNKGTSTAQTLLSFFGDLADPSGSGPLTLPLTFPQQGSQMLNSVLNQNISANASLIVTTPQALTSPVLVGSAQLASMGAVDGFAIFHQILTTQEAVVPMETRNATSYLLAYDNTGGVALGVAVENVSAQAGTIGVVIRDDTGTQISTGSIPMSANGHTSFVLSTQYPITANIRGTIEFDTPLGGRISVLGLRFTPPNNSLTTIPALANVGTGGGSIAHLASGGDGWQTTFVLVNTGASSAQFTLSFFADQTGAPLSLPLSFPQPNGGAPSVAPSVTQNLPAGATRVIVSSGAVNLLTGSAQLATSGQVSGFVIFRHNNQEAVVPLESRSAGGYIIAFDNTNGTATGIAVNAVSTQPVNIPVVVRNDAGTQITSDTLNLAPNGHLAFTLVSQKYPATANIRGTIEFDKPANAQIGALGIRIPPTQTYTTLPALAVP